MEISELPIAGYEIKGKLFNGNEMNLRGTFIEKNGAYREKTCRLLYFKTRVSICWKMHVRSMNLVYLALLHSMLYCTQPQK